MKQEGKILAKKLQADIALDFLDIVDNNTEKIKKISNLTYVILMVNGFLIIMDHKIA